MLRNPLHARRGRATRAARARLATRAARLRAAGFSLVEVLVAMFVVAMGILALAGLLQASTRYSKMSELRSTATLLANDIADRVRANPVGAELGAGGYDITDHAFPSAPAPAHAACTSDAPCSPADLAKADLADWTARVRATLPKGSAWIEFHAGHGPAPDSVDVWVGWADPLTLSPGASTDRSGTECPTAWKQAEPSVRCVYVQVAP
jgi:type IV pilus assembly protein PilV